MVCVKIQGEDIRKTQFSRTTNSNTMKMIPILILAFSTLIIIIVVIGAFKGLSNDVKTQNTEIQDLKTKSDSLSVLAAKKTKERHNQQLREAFRNGWYKGGNAALEACTKAAVTGTKIKDISIEADSLKFEQLFIDK